MIVIIPAYEPDNRLIELCTRLKQLPHEELLIVDDGSGEDYRHIFAALAAQGCTILTHTLNQGKGAALKTAFQELLQRQYDGVIVCADCDGQHTLHDIRAVAAAVSAPKQIVLGTRVFVGAVPFRSRFGNLLTAAIYRYVTGIAINDTQTGLRAYSASLLPWLCSIKGDRFEYEMRMLMQAAEQGVEMVEVTIETIYLEHNKSSHFRPIKDSLLVYWPILKFAAASLISFLLDFVVLLVLYTHTDQLLISVMIARAISSLCNFTLNRQLVFLQGKKSSLYSSVWKYFSLVILNILCNYALLYVLTAWQLVPFVPAKLAVEALLFLFSYWVQQRHIFRTRS